MKKLIIVFLFLSPLLFSQTFTLTGTDSTEQITVYREWLEITIVDTGSVADTIHLFYPVTIDETTDSARVGKILDASTGEYVTRMISSTGEGLCKVYILWMPYPRSVLFVLGDTSTGTINVVATQKP